MVLDVMVHLAASILLITGGTLLYDDGLRRRCDHCARRFAWWRRGHPAFVRPLELCWKCKRAHDKRQRVIVRFPSS